MSFDTQTSLDADGTAMPVPVAESAPLPSAVLPDPARSVEIGLGHSIDLKKLFPQSRLRPLRYAAPVILACMLGFMLVLAGPAGFSPKLPPIQQTLCALITLGLAGVALARLIYELLYCWTFRYGIEDFRLVVRRGVILATEASLPLSPSAEIYIRQRLRDKLFGLYEIHIMMGAESSRLYGKIEGLGKREAFGMKKFLSGCFAKFTFIAPDGQSMSLSVANRPGRAPLRSAKAR